MSLSIQNSAPGSCHHTLDRRKFVIPSGSIFSKIYFPEQQKVVEETMIYCIKIQLENMNMNWNYARDSIW